MQQANEPFHCPWVYASTINAFDYKLLFSHLLLNLRTFPSDLGHPPSCSLHWPSIQVVNREPHCLEAPKTVCTYICVLLKWLVISQIKQLDSSRGEDPCHVIWGLGGVWGRSRRDPSNVWKLPDTNHNRGTAWLPGGRSGTGAGPSQGRPVFEKGFHGTWETSEWPSVTWLWQCLDPLLHLLITTAKNKMLFFRKGQRLIVNRTCYKGFQGVCTDTQNKLW